MSTKGKSEEKFEELEEEELQKAKNLSVMEEFIDLDSEANSKLKQLKKH